MLYFIIYMIQVIPTIRNMTQALAGFSFVSTLILWFAYSAYADEICAPKIMKFAKILTVTCCVSTLLGLLTPNKTTLYQMSAVYLGKQINKSVQVDAKIQKISTIMDLQLDKTIKELTQDTK